MDGSNYCQKWEQLGASGNIDNWKNIWQECADWCLPSKDNILRVNVEGTEKPVQRMIDTCIEANYNFATGFHSRLFPSGSMWGKFKHPDPKKNAIDVVARWFEESSRIIHSILIESNFTQESQKALMDIGPFGTNCLYVEPDDDSVVNFRSFKVGTFRIGLNNKGRVDTVGRELTLDSRQMIQEFGEETLRKADMAFVMDELQKPKKYTVYHLVHPRKDYDPKKTDKKNLPFASVYVCKQGKKILKEGGYTMLPYFIGRFAVGNNDTYGWSPMMMVLGTSRRTNVIYRSLIATAELNSNPQWLIPDDDSVRGLSNRAGSLIRYRISSGKPERLQDNGNPAMAKEMFDMHEENIKRAFFNHLFRPLDEYRNMTAFEVQTRLSTDMMSLAPFASRYLDEVVTPMMTYVWYLANEAGLLPEMPSEVQDDPRFKIEYLGPLSLATMSFETQGAFSVMNMFAEIARYIPQAQEGFRNIDFDGLFKQTWYNSNAPMTVLRPQEDVDEERQAEAQAVAQQQQMAQLPELAHGLNMVSKKPDEGSPADDIIKQLKGRA